MSATDPHQVFHRTIEAVWRIESARVIAGLTRLTRDLDLAEDRSAHLLKNECLTGLTPIYRRMTAVPFTPLAAAVSRQHGRHPFHSHVYRCFVPVTRYPRKLRKHLAVPLWFEKSE